MNENQKTLDINVPADAIVVIETIISRLRMDGLTGAEVNALFTSIDTIKSKLTTD